VKFQTKPLGCRQQKKFAEHGDNQPNIPYLINYVIRISPEGVDIILDCLCGDDCNRGYGLLKPMGKYILFGSSNVVTGETKSFFSVARSVILIRFYKMVQKIKHFFFNSGGRLIKFLQLSFLMKIKLLLASISATCCINKMGLNT
jgi:NADPH:quinone reductase-like Zn-dependent oxidoreductase